MYSEVKKSKKTEFIKQYYFSVKTEITTVERVVVVSDDLSLTDAWEKLIPELFPKYEKEINFQKPLETIGTPLSIEFTKSTRVSTKYYSNKRR